jgi:hypothetical protein
MQRKIILACFGMAGVLLLVWFLGGQGGASAYQAAIPAVSAQDVASAAPIAVAAKTARTVATRRPVTIIPPPTTTSIPLTPPMEREKRPEAQNSAPDARGLPTPVSAATPAPTQAPDIQTGTPAAAPAAAAPDSAAQPVRRLMDPAAPAAINGVPLDGIIVMSDDTLQTIRRIYALGQEQGRNPHAFAKVGDSTMAWPPLLNIFSDPASYRLGPYNYLQPTVARYADAFGWTSAAVKKGMHTWTEFDPSWVTGNRCNPGEMPLECELRLTNPSVAFIRLGANDAFEPTEFDQSMRQIVGLCVSRGIIPVLGTKPDRREGPDNTINKLVARIAADYGVPLWDYDRIAATVPGKGLLDDGIHYRGIGPHDYTSGGTFTNGDSLEDLTALMMLDTITRAVAPQTAQAAASGAAAQN